MFGPTFQLKDEDFTRVANDNALQYSLSKEAFERHANRMADTNKASVEEARRLLTGAASLFGQAADPMGFFSAFQAYAKDTQQRTILTLDALRKRGDIFVQHEKDGCPPVLIYDYEIIVDGKDLPRPCNYILLHILPPEGVEVMAWKRPYVIIDPRAGHGPGIGGFKSDSQVGVALKDGHPVYFVAFRPMPEPGQILADVTHAEAAFIREIQKRHPDAPKPIVVGNCQGGWATAILAATSPDITGPIVLNGAPMSYWSGRMGQDPMRYVGGQVGGVLPAMLTADMNGGLFDGANLVLNFETLNPGRTWFRKYYDLYANIDEGEERFLDFETWWGGFFLMTAEEITWIVDNLFVGNKLGKNEARLETGRPIDLKAIRAPIIVFASHGDNITPPQQALNWIVDTYADEIEIEIRGQRILYMVHEDVGHLGIFVSSSIAKREHTQMASTLKTIEALPPGLYEMVIEDTKGEGHEKSFSVSFVKRKTSDILALDDARDEEQAFAAVARLSETVANIYDAAVRPAIKAMNPPEKQTLKQQLHPMRAQRSFFASQNPLMSGVERAADAVRSDRRVLSDDNPFKQMEKFWVHVMEAQWDTIRDWRAFSTEMTFLSLYANPFALAFGAPHSTTRKRKRPEDLRTLPNVVEALERINVGGFGEAVVRMLVLLADTRGDVRRDRLERASEVLTTRKPFSDLEAPIRAKMIQDQTLVTHFEPEAALDALPKMLTTKKMRKDAVDLVRYVVGDPSEMEAATQAMLQDIERKLDLASPSTSVEAAE